MCLKVKGFHKFGKIAKNDIVCYKILQQNCYGEFKTPYQYTKVHKNEIKGLMPLLPAENIRYKFRLGTLNVGAGFIHTYKNFSDALNNVYYGAHIIFPCIIPKGTFYYEGCDGTNSSGYASEQIIFKDWDTISIN